MKKLITIVYSLFLISSILVGQSRNISHFKSSPFMGNERFKTNIQPVNENPFLKAASLKQTIDSLAEMNFDTLNKKWNTDTKIAYKYNSQGKEIQEISVMWEEDSNKFLNNYKLEYSYNNGVVESETYSYPDSSFNFKLYNKRVYYFDDQERLLTIKNLILDTVCHVDANAKPVCDTSWKESSKDSLFYGLNGKVYEEVFYGYSLEWYKSSKYQTNYNLNGTISSKIYYNWDNATEEWIFQDKDEYFYNADGTEKEKIYSVYKNGKWIQVSKIANEYDTNKNLAQDHQYDFDTIASVWIEASRVNYYYDLQYKFSDCIKPNGYWGGENYFINKLTGYSALELVSGQWKETYKVQFYYSQKEYVGLKAHQNSINVYPNPAHEYISIDGLSENTGFVEIYDLQGRQLISRECINSMQINVSNLQPGMYIIIINSNKNTYVSKILIQ